MTREEVRSLLRKRNTAEDRFSLAWMDRTEGKVWDKTVGKYGAWVTPKAAA